MGRLTGRLERLSLLPSSDIRTGQILCPILRYVFSLQDERSNRIGGAMLLEGNDETSCDPFQLFRYGGG